MYCPATWPVYRTCSCNPSGNKVVGAVETYNLPPVVVGACKSGAAMVEGVNPIYLGAAGAVAASGLLMLAYGCRASPKKSKGSGSKSKKKSKSSKSKSAASNGVPHLNGGGIPGNGVAADSGSGGSNAGGSRGLKANPGGTGGGAAAPAPGGAKAPPARPAKKAAAKAPAQGKGKGKMASDPPPVITVRGWYRCGWSCAALLCWRLEEVSGRKMIRWDASVHGVSVVGPSLLRESSFKSGRACMEP